MRIVIVIALVCLAALAACSRKSDPPQDAPASQATAPVTLATFAISGAESTLTRDGVSFDATTSRDGNGSFRLEAAAPTTFRLFEVTGLAVEDARLIYRAGLRTQNVSGTVYLEMWCVFPELGEFFSRGLQDVRTGTVDWSSAETPFFLEQGQIPSVVKLNVVVDGTGTVWVDDVTLVRGPR